jgi:hypothetical protein
MQVVIVALSLAPLALTACSDSDGVECPDRFDSKAWRGAAFDSDERRELAQQVERCGYVRGANKARVRELLGPIKREPEVQYPSEFKREWYYPVGETNGTYGPADEQNLWIRFDKRGRVKRAEVSP